MGTVLKGRRLFVLHRILKVSFSHSCFHYFHKCVKLFWSYFILGDDMSTPATVCKSNLQVGIFSHLSMNSPSFCCYLVVKYCECILLPEPCIARQRAKRP